MASVSAMAPPAMSPAVSADDRLAELAERLSDCDIPCTGPELADLAGPGSRAFRRMAVALLVSAGASSKEMVSAVSSEETVSAGVSFKEMVEVMTPAEMRAELIAAAVKAGVPESIAANEPVPITAIEELVAAMQARRMLAQAASVRTGSSGDTSESAMAAECVRRVAAAAGVDQTLNTSAAAALRAAADTTAGAAARAEESGAMRRLVDPTALSDVQTALLGEVHAALTSEYRVRREMVIKVRAPACGPPSQLALLPAHGADTACVWRRPRALSSAHCARAHARACSAPT